MQNKKCLSLLTAVCIVTSVFAQLGRDSLNKLIQQHPEDTNKVHLYWEAGASVIYQAPGEAIPYFIKGTALATRLGFVPGIEKCQNATSLAYSLQGEYDSALLFINDAIPNAINAGNTKRLALVYLNRADIYRKLQNFSAALKDCDTAMLYAEKDGNKDGMGRIHSIISSIYITLRQYPPAISNLDKSLYYFTTSGNRQMVAMTHADKADLYAQTGEDARAIPLYKMAVEIADSLKDLTGLSVYYGGLAQTYSHINSFEAATAAAKSSLRYAKENGSETQQANAYMIMGTIQIAQKKYADAIVNSLQAYHFFKAQQDLEREKIAAAHLAEAYQKNGNYNQAYEYLQISSNLNDSLLHQQFANETAGLQSSFELKQKNKEIELLNKEQQLQQQKQRLLLIGAIAIMLLAIAGVSLLVNRNKLRQRMKELELRNQIAADLHDEVGSSLSSIHMLSQMATRHGSTASHQQILEKMATNSKETMDKMNDIVWMIKPGETEAGNLKERMERFAFEMGESKSMEVVMELGELDKTNLTMKQRKNIYLIFKEAVNNAAKYSGSPLINVTSTKQNDILKLRIKDEGKGFDSALIKKGNGLGNMLERAKEMGGELSIDSRIGKGTAVELSLIC